jgi:hypothetical protein
MANAKREWPEHPNPNLQAPEKLEITRKAGSQRGGWLIHFLVGFGLLLVCFWFARFNSRVVIGQNDCWQPAKTGVCKPFLLQINFSNRKSIVDLRYRGVDSGLGLATRLRCASPRQRDCGIGGR